MDEQTQLNRSRRTRFEVIFASVWLALGLFVLPAVIFTVGITLLGPYGEGQGAGMGTFYGDFYGDLADGEVRAWAIALGPLALISLIRLIFIGVRPTPAPKSEPATDTATPPRVVPRPAESRRVEPRVGAE